MKLLQIVSPAIERDKGVMESKISYVNPRYIISVEEEWDCTAITIQGGMTRTLRDYRDTEEIIDLIEQIDSQN